MILIAHHRSEALAARHLTNLRHQYPRVELLSRRNAQGQYSAHGRTFTYEVEEKERPKKIEAVLHFDYGFDPKKHNLIRFQVHVFAPGEASDKEILNAVRERQATGEWPRGYSQKAIYWSHPPAKPKKHPAWYAARPLPRGLRRTAISGGEGNVISWRDTIRQNRNPRRDRKAKK